VGYGATTARAGEALYLGKHHSTTGSKTTNGNGSAMRSAPLGLILGHKAPEDIKNVTSVFSSITHASEACIDGSIAIAFGAKTAMATRGIRLDPAKFLEQVCAHVDNAEYKAELRNIDHLLRGSDSEAKIRFVTYGTRAGEEQWGDGISSGVRQSSLWAIYAFCKHPDDYKSCISVAIGCGGDVDTTAAMAGALVGARLGFAGIPQVWRETIHDVDVWGLEDICGLVRSVYVMVSEKRVWV
jgi:ADP-ribosylglycohydrolase